MAHLGGLAARIDTTADNSTELSSSSISSPPVSPRQTELHDNIHVRPLDAHLGAAAKISAAPVSAPAPSTAPPDKPKRQRKKKEVDADGKPIDDGKPKEKKPRKPREPKDKTAANGTTTANPRKKIKLEDKTAVSEAAAAAPRKLNLFDMLGPTKPADTPIAISSQAAPPPASLQPSSMTASRPISSGQRYDPVRAAMMDAMSTTQNTTHFSKASASPSIASLIDPPARSTAATPSALRSPPSAASGLLQSSPAAQTTLFTARPAPASPSPAVAHGIHNGASHSMEVDQPTTSFTAATRADVTQDNIIAPSKPASTAPTPKPAAPRSSPSAAKGTGSGLLSTSDLTGDASGDSVLARKGVNIDIQITLNPAGANHVNVAQEIIKKYGRDALFPRAAAHREELLQVMYAGKNVSAGSADDMSLDNSDLEDDSNVEMGGMDDTADGEKSRKRRKKVEEYDLDDEFIDDTELAWQQQAAVAKDGFFVYSGPLRSESEKAAAESASASARGGRGRGRGRGRAAAGTTHASLAEKKDTTTSPAAPSGRGSRGGRTRGTAAPRKRAAKPKTEADKTIGDLLSAGTPAPPAASAAVTLAAPQPQQSAVTTA